VIFKTKYKFVYIVRSTCLRAMPWLTGLQAGLTLQVQVRTQAGPCDMCDRPNGKGARFGCGMSVALWLAQGTALGFIVRCLWCGMWDILSLCG
jgi:hypothetical protein